MNADCTKETICVLEGGAPTPVFNDLPGCLDNEVCEAREGENFRQCHCVPGFKLIDGVCQGNLNKSILNFEFNLSLTQCHCAPEFKLINDVCQGNLNQF